MLASVGINLLRKSSFFAVVLVWVESARVLANRSLLLQGREKLAL